VLHQDSNQIQTDLRKLRDPSPSPLRRRTWIASSRFEMREATPVRGPPILDFDSDSNKEYPSITIPGRGGLGDGGATACREVPVLVIYSQPDDYSESFSDSHPGLIITSTPQGCFRYWKGLVPFKVLESDSHLVAQSTLQRIDPRELEILDYSAQHRCATATTSTTRLAPQSGMPRQTIGANDIFDNSSRLETSRDRATNYSVTSSAWLTTSQNQL
jgi:hypothetical protein